MQKSQMTAPQGIGPYGKMEKKTFLWRYRLFELYWFWTKIIWKSYQTGLTPPMQYKPGISVMVLGKSYKKGCTWLTATSDKVYQLLAHGRWFFPDTLASSTTNTGRHNIADILLKVALKHQKSNKSLKIVFNSLDLHPIQVNM
jgi:hypothetical protein